MSESYLERFSARALAPHRRTKIVATLGPASRGGDKVRALIEAGVNVFRLNFSHGSHDEHLSALRDVREQSAQLDIPTAILQDLSGPKIRIGLVQGDSMTLKDGSEVTLSLANGSPSTPELIYVEGLNPSEILKAGQPVFLADGAVALEARSVSSHTVKCFIVKGGRIRSRVGIAFPESAIDLPATTEKDLVDLAWGIEHKVDYAAISFVQSAEDIERLRKIIVAQGADIKIIAKIERKKALQAIREIIDSADGVMVARGDLGLELPLETLPLIQRDLIERCNHRGIPVIVATQMLQSMVSSVRPTRAEVSDIATAVMSGTDAVMLSDETAVGEHPIDAVKFLSRIAHSAELSFEFEEYKLRLRDSDRDTVPDAVAYAACAAANKVGAGVIVACTETGSSARLVAKYRPQQPLYGVTGNSRTLQRMCLYWGVTPLTLSSVVSREEETSESLKKVAAREKLPSKSRAIVTGGALAKKAGSTTIMEIREIP
jgi:pyruvate kinase